MPPHNHVHPRSHPHPCFRGWIWVVWANQSLALSCWPLWLELVQSDWRERLVSYDWERSSFILPSLCQTWVRKQEVPIVRGSHLVTPRRTTFGRKLMWKYLEWILDVIIEPLIIPSLKTIWLLNFFLEVLLRGFNIPKHTMIFQEGSVVYTLSFPNIFEPIALAQRLVFHGTHGKHAFWSF